jgi:hypothetical protein
MVPTVGLLQGELCSALLLYILFCVEEWVGDAELLLSLTPFMPS